MLFFYGFQFATAASTGNVKSLAESFLTTFYFSYLIINAQLVSRSLQDHARIIATGLEFLLHLRELRVRAACVNDPR